MDSLSRVLAGPVLENIGRITASRVWFGQAQDPPRRPFPPMNLCTGLHQYDVHDPGTAPYVYPGIATVLEGRLHVNIGDSLYLARRGDWLIFPRNVRHREFCLPSHTPYRLMWFQFPGHAWKLAVSRYSGKNDFHIDAYCAFRKPVAGTFTGADDIMRNPEQPVESIQRKLVQLLSWWLDALDATSGQPIHYSDYSVALVEKITAILESTELMTGEGAGPTRPPVSVGELAKQLGLSVNYVSQSFRRQTGQRLQQAIQARRIDRARHCLAESTIPIKEIALLLGFADSQHFSHAFSRLVGMSPTLYRDKHSISR